MRPHRALRPPHPTTGLPRPTQSNPDRHPTTRRRLPHPPRPHRQQRQAHPAPQQPPTPHRNGPSLRRHQRPDPRPRPTHPDHHHRRPTTTRTSPRPDKGLPTTNQTVNDVPRHMCTMSRDIALPLQRRFEPQFDGCGQRLEGGRTHQPSRIRDLIDRSLLLSESPTARTDWPGPGGVRRAVRRLGHWRTVCEHDGKPVC